MERKLNYTFYNRDPENYNELVKELGPFSTAYYRGELVDKLDIRYYSYLLQLQRIAILD